MKSIYIISILLTAVITLQSGMHSSSAPPTGYTGSTGAFCTNCHAGTLNAIGGSVIINGLPSGGYVPNTKYPLSVTITHSAANRTRWGFAISAVNTAGTSIGSFSSTNSNAALIGNELAHKNAVSTSASASYTYNNLFWTAPPINVGVVNFYYVGNAANGSGSSGDFIYSGSNNISLPINLKYFNAVQKNGTVVINWQTLNEIEGKYFEIERSDDGQFFYSLEKINSNNPLTTNESYSFVDKKASSNSVILYRLKMTDQNNIVKYSSVIKVNGINTEFAIKKVYPSIIKSGGSFNVEIESEKNRLITLDLLDINGKEKQSQKINLFKGSNLIKLTAYNLENTNGIVILKIEGDNLILTKTLVCSY
jgi:hypothetical protein